MPPLAQDMNYAGSTCICRVPKAQLKAGVVVECTHCGQSPPHPPACFFSREPCTLTNDHACLNAHTDSAPTPPFPRFRLPRLRFHRLMGTHQPPACFSPFSFDPI